MPRPLVCRVHIWNVNVLRVDNAWMLTCLYIVRRIPFINVVDQRFESCIDIQTFVSFACSVGFPVRKFHLNVFLFFFLLAHVY